LNDPKRFEDDFQCPSNTKCVNFGRCKSICEETLGGILRKNETARVVFQEEIHCGFNRSSEYYPREVSAMVCCELEEISEEEQCGEHIITQVTAEPSDEPTTTNDSQLGFLFRFKGETCGSDQECVKFDRCRSVCEAAQKGVYATNRTALAEFVDKVYCGLTEHANPNASLKVCCSEEDISNQSCQREPPFQITAVGKLADPIRLSDDQEPLDVDENMFIIGEPRGNADMEINVRAAVDTITDPDEEPTQNRNVGRNGPIEEESTALLGALVFKAEDTTDANIAQENVILIAEDIFLKSTDDESTFSEETTEIKSDFYGEDLDTIREELDLI